MPIPPSASRLMLRRVMSLLVLIAVSMTVAACPAHAGSTHASSTHASSMHASSTHAISARAGSMTTGAASSRHVVTPEQFGARGNGKANDTAALQRALDAVRPGGVLHLRSGAVYRHTGVLRARVHDETITGHATLLATNPADSSFWIMADHVTVNGPTFRTVNVKHRYDAYEQMGLRLAGVRGAVVENVTVVGSAAAGIYVGQSCCSGPVRHSSDFHLTHVQVTNTHADGIHMTDGSNHGGVRDATIRNSGDDGIAVVSYQQTNSACNHIAVSHSRVLGTSWGRGISVVGGHDVSYTDMYVSRTNAAGVYLAEEGGAFDTLSTHHVVLRRIRVVEANVNPGIGHGAVLIYCQRRGYVVSDISIDDLSISRTPRSAPWEVGMRRDHGTISDVTIDNVTITGHQSPLSGNIGRDDYSARSWVVDGRRVTNQRAD